MLFIIIYTLLTLVTREGRQVSKRKYHQRMMLSGSFPWRFAFCPLPSGMDDFSLAKVERHKGDGKYRTHRAISQDSFRKTFPFYAKMGIPKTLKRNSLPYTFSFGTLIERAKKKSIPDKDMGIKKAHRLKNRTKE